MRDEGEGDGRADADPADAWRPRPGPRPESPGAVSAAERRLGRLFAAESNGRAAGSPEHFPGVPRLERTPAGPAPTAPRPRPRPAAADRPRPHAGP